MAKLGYTWYSKDWKTNEKVFNLTLEMKGFYRELIDYAYENDNHFSINRKYFCRMMNINGRKFDTLFARLLESELILLLGDYCTIPSVEPRIQLIRGGKKGGETSKPTQKPNLKPDSNQRERETKSKREREINNKKRFNFRKELIGHGFEIKIIDEWLQVRRNRKLTNSETALNRLLEEINKATTVNLNPNDILKICVENSWGGFKASWLEKEKSSDKKEKSSSLSEKLIKEHGLK